MRNLPRSGVGFYENAGFYPDFLLWLVRGARQVLGFVDPKGLVHWNEGKVRMLAFIGKQSLADLPMRAFVVSETPLDLVGAMQRDNHNSHIPKTLAALRDRNVVLQDDPEYVDWVLARLADAL